MGRKVDTEPTSYEACEKCETFLCFLLKTYTSLIHLYLGSRQVIIKKILIDESIILKFI